MACVTEPSPPAAPTAANRVTLLGTVLIRERIALQPDARLAVRISDVSRMDVAAPVVAQTEIATRGRQAPFAFSLDYDPAHIEPRHRYAVSARLTDGDGRLLWVTDTHVALPPSGETVVLRLVRTQALPRPR